MSNSRLCMVAAAALTGTLILPATPTAAHVLQSVDPSSSIQLTADDGSTVTVTAAKKVMVDGGTHYLGEILIDLVVNSRYDAAIVLFDLDGDDVVDLQMSPGDPVRHHTFSGWDDTHPRDVTSRGCFDGGEVTQGSYEFTYDSTCLDAGESIRVSAAMYTGPETFPIGDLHLWSDPVATPSYAWDYCGRRVGEMPPGSGSRVLLQYTAVNKISCAKGATVLRKAHRAFRKNEREKIRIGKFTCTFPNMISAQIDCKHRKNRKRWAYSWSMP